MPEFADWVRAFAMMGTDGTDYIPVLLGPDGSMYSVLQGEYDGALKTVKLDSEGRMSAFIIDSVDAWTRMLTIGNAELAVRLGSPVIYDRRGQVLFMDTFEQGMRKWTTAMSGTNAAVALSPLAALMSGYSVKLTGGSTASYFAAVQRIVPSRPVGRIGLEFSLSLSSLWDYVQVTLYLYTGTQNLFGVVRWYYTDYELKAYDSGTGYVNVGTGKILGVAASNFNTIKFVLDMDTEKYVRLMFNNQEIDISTLNLHVVADTTTAPSIEVDVCLYSRDGYTDTLYLDNVILTAAEPE